MLHAGAAVACSAGAALWIEHFPSNKTGKKEELRMHKLQDEGKSALIYYPEWGEMKETFFWPIK